MENHIATSEDFKKAAEAEAFGEPERVVLPKSGLPVVLRRPRARAFALGRASLPQSLAAKLIGDQSVSNDPERAAASIAFWSWMFERMFERPRLSLNPSPAEIHPDWILPEDQEFLFRWAVGEVASDGSDLVRFRRGESRRSADAGNDGEALRDPAGSPAGPAGGSVSN